MAVQEVVDALVAGAAAGGKDAATAAVKDAYAGLKALVTRRLVDHPSAASTLATVETRAVEAGSEDAVTPGRRAGLVEELAEAGVESDAELLEAARRLLTVLAEAGLRGGVSADRNAVDARWSQGTIVGGSHGSITQHYGTPPGPHESPGTMS